MIIKQKQELAENPFKSRQLLKLIKMKKVTQLIQLSLMTFALFAFMSSTSSLSAQNLVYGDTYKVENTWMGKAAYLDVNGQGCQDNYLCVSTTRSADRKKSNTTDWIIMSASGKSVGEPVQAGDMILLKNPWMRGSYLGTRGYSKDFGCPGYLCVSAWQNIEKGESTTWQITGDVQAKGTIQLIGQWNNASAGHLDINGHHEGGGYNVCTATDGRKAQSSTMWRFLPTKKEVANNNTLKSGETLKAGEKLTSANGKYILSMQDDGNLCVYNYANGQQGGFVWGSMKYGFGNGKLTMQTDGNLVVYDGNGEAKWNSETHPHFNDKFRDSNNKPVKLVLEDDGKIKLYTASGSVVWSN